MGDENGRGEGRRETGEKIGFKYKALYKRNVTEKKRRGEKRMQKEKKKK